MIDKTDLKGLFDYELRFSPEGLAAATPFGALPPPSGGGAAGSAPPAASTSEPLPSLFTALQDLGLKLEFAKGPVNVLVIDSVQKPKAN